MPAELRSVDALPDQIASPQFCGAMVAKVPFLHPGKIFNIIMVSQNITARLAQTKLFCVYISAAVEEAVGVQCSSEQLPWSQ